MSTSQIFSGARAVLKLSGLAVGYAMNCSGTTGINYTPLNVLGHLEVVEHVPTAYTVELTASLARVATVSRLNQGAAASFPGTFNAGSVNDSGDSPQIMPSFGITGTNILTTGEMQADIFDRVIGGEALYTVRGVKCAQKAWEIAAGGMVAENCSFVARIESERGEALETG